MKAFEHAVCYVRSVAASHSRSSRDERVLSERALAGINNSKRPSTMAATYVKRSVINLADAYKIVDLVRGK